MRKRTKTLKLAKRMIRYNITYDAAKKNFIPQVTAVSSLSKCDTIDVPDLNLLYFTQAEAMENITKKIVSSQSIVKLIRQMQKKCANS